jgi:phage repressor protein C with HTH and peptisase S24 domain
MEAKEIRRKNVYALVKAMGGPTAFGAAVGRDQVQVSQWTAGKPLGDKLARHIEDSLGKPLGWLDAPHWDEAEDIPAETLTEIPVYDARAAAGFGADNAEARKIGTLFFRPRSLERKAIRSENAHVFSVSGDSMVPRLYHGDSVLFDASDTGIKNGKIYVLKVGDDTLVKRLFQQPDGFVRVSSDNKADPQFADFSVRQDEVTVLGRVRWVGSWEE